MIWYYSFLWFNTELILPLAISVVHVVFNCSPPIVIIRRLIFMFIHCITIHLIFVSYFFGGYFFVVFGRLLLFILFLFILLLFDLIFLTCFFRVIVIVYGVKVFVFYSYNYLIILNTSVIEWIIGIIIIPFIISIVGGVIIGVICGVIIVAIPCVITIGQVVITVTKRNNQRVMTSKGMDAVNSTVRNW